MRALTILPAILLISGMAWAGPPSKTPASGPSRAESRILLRNYALAYCLGQGFPAMGDEARQAAWAYLENGTASTEAHAEVRALAGAFLARSYPSFSGARLDVMKCIDLWHSRELDALVDKALPSTRPRRSTVR